MLRKVVMVGVMLWTLGGIAWAQVAMLTQVSGDVKVAGKGGARDAVAFLKVNEGDTLTLAGTGRVQMVYLEGGRQEIWKGAGQVTVGKQDGRSTALKPETSQLPPLILRQLTKTPAAGQTGKTGMVMLRSLDDLEAMDRLEQDYEKFRAAAAPDDPTPEVFLLTGWLETKEFDKARKKLEELRAKQATMPSFAPVVEHFSRLITEASAAR